MEVKAAVAHRSGAALSIETVQLDGPRRGEVLVEIKATGICHTDEFTLSGADPEVLFPAILGHEGAGIVVDIGSDVTTLKRVIMSSRYTLPNVDNVNFASAEKRISVRQSGRHKARVLCQMGPAVFRSEARKFITTWGLRPLQILLLCRKSR